MTMRRVPKVTWMASGPQLISQMTMLRVPKVTWMAGGPQLISQMTMLRVPKVPWMAGGQAGILYRDPGPQPQAHPLQLPLP